MRLVLDLERMKELGIARVEGDEGDTLELRPQDGATKRGKDRTPYMALARLYHETLPELPAVRRINAQFKAAMRQRWREHPDMDWWGRFFRYVRRSPFLMGETDHGFRASLRWLVKDSNFSKVIEGHYDPRD